MTIFSPVNRDEIFSLGRFSPAESYAGLKFLSGRAEISARETGMKLSPD
jgi:hypothetical protein